MSYCVHCGVELDKDAHRCPLCGTQVIDLSCPGDENYGKAFFPNRPAQVEPVSKKGMALLLTSMLVSVAVCCGLLNLVLKPGTPWSLFVMGAAMMLWVWLVLPLLARWLPLWGRMILDLAAVALYVWIISLALDGHQWFMGLAVPILLFTALDNVLLGIVFRKRRSMLTTMTAMIATVGVYCLEIELCCDRYLFQAIDLNWSLVVFACCIGICVPLIVVRRVPSLRSEARRRFHI